MAMSVSPGSKSWPGFCHNRRHGKRSAQKQIICPIYRGLASGRPYRLGLEPAFFAPTGRMRHPQEVRHDSLLECYLNTSNLTGTRPFRSLRQGLRFRRESRKTWLFGRKRLSCDRIRSRDHEVMDARHDFRFEARAVEHAVMSNALLNVMNAAMIRNRAAQCVRCFSLTET